MVVIMSILHDVLTIL